MANILGTREIALTHPGEVLLEEFMEVDTLGSPYELRS
jgi:hypothetical protein